MEKVTSLEQFKSLLNKEETNYLLILKKGSEKSDCAFGKIENITRDFPDIRLSYADVSSTTDIHPAYHIDSAPSLLEFEGVTLKNVFKGCQHEGFYKSLFNNAIYVSEAKKSGKAPVRVTVYSTPTCSWCNTLKSYLRKNRIIFQDIDVSRDLRAADEMVKRSGQMGVPQTDINGEIIIGFNKSRIDELLNIHDH